MKHLSILFIFLMTLGTTTIKAQQESVDTTLVEHSDTVKVSWGKTKFIIINNDPEVDSDKEVDAPKVIKQRFNHFAGIDIGINGLLTETNSVDLHREGEFMDLNYRKSISLALNLWEWYIPVAKEKVGFSTGIGFEFNNYDLDRDFDVLSTKDRTFGMQDTTKRIEKNRFKSTMLNLPLFLETNIGKDAAHSFHLAIGGQISYRLGSKTKQIFEQDSKDYKVKNRNDYNMNDFRFNAVARVGYGDFTLFASYSLTPMFEKDKGPELYPFTVGISMLSW